MTGQAPAHVVLVRPHRFHPNPLTAADNAFQHDVTAPSDEIARRARREVGGLAEVLTAAGVEVHIFEDEGAATPDSVFPNNWLSTHEDGTVVLYPMCAPNRRAERRADVVTHLRERFAVRRVLDLSGYEDRSRFLEGTGAMVLDHVGRIAYACRSRRLDPELFALTCTELGYAPLLMDAADRDGTPVYHTNVLMSVGSEVAVVGSEMIRDPGQRERVLGSLRGSGRDVVEISEDQVQGFLGNCLEVSGRDGPALVMSARAAGKLSTAQRRRIERSCRILTAEVPTIEAAGGSVRCMIAGIHLPREQAPSSTGMPSARITVVPQTV
ncbi:amidinotransferase [Brachybacterium sp. P6-10-X1]|uniref:citrulline utilization hydrolase CtlX n=1 Tax=Brachybacterium sp. P6-10-X1 TaxID=1903186 RepID=UPI000971A880|nr:arginine deiminase-related protein [Brachybacterium sp. P6-10-X1]APX34153.1 amidinotransferase [Brachybacterium sp. P6-10-X1]